MGGLKNLTTPKQTWIVSYDMEAMHTQKVRAQFLDIEDGHLIFHNMSYSHDSNIVLIISPNMYACVFPENDDS